MNVSSIRTPNDRPLNSTLDAAQAEHLAKLPEVYWAEGPYLMRESRDGTGPCPVLHLVGGKYDMDKLAWLLNQCEGKKLTPSRSLCESTHFFVEGEYISRREPQVTFCSHTLAYRVAAVLNSTVATDENVLTGDAPQ